MVKIRIIRGQKKIVHELYELKKEKEIRGKKISLVIHLAKKNQIKNFSYSKK